MLIYVKKEVKELHGKIDVIAVTTGAFNGHDWNVHENDVQSKISLKRKHSSFVTVILKEGGSASSSSTASVIDDSSLKLNVNFQRCLIRHNLCRSLKNTSLGEHSHFCESSLLAGCYKPSNIIVIHAFISGRTLIDNHSFSDVMRQHHIITQRFMISVLTTLYLEQVKNRFFETAKRQQLDTIVVQRHVRLWKFDHLTNSRDSLYFTLLANQYIVSLSYYQTIWYRITILKDYQVEIENSMDSANCTLASLRRYSEGSAASRRSWASSKNKFALNLLWYRLQSLFWPAQLVLVRSRRILEWHWFSRRPFVKTSEHLRPCDMTITRVTTIWSAWNCLAWRTRKIETISVASWRLVQSRE